MELNKKSQASALLGLPRDIAIANSTDPGVIGRHLRRFWVDQFDSETRKEDSLELHRLIRGEFEKSKEIHTKIQRAMKFAVRDNVLTQLKNPILVPVLMSGFHSGAFVSSQFDLNQIPHDIALVGCTIRSAEKNIFRNGVRMAPKVYIAPPDTRFLLENTGRPIILVDDVVASGETLRHVGNALTALGFSKIDVKIIPTISRFE